MGKGEIAHYQQPLLFPQYFQKAFTADTLKPGLVWERVKTIIAPNLGFCDAQMKLLSTAAGRQRKHSKWKIPKGADFLHHD